MSKHDSQSETDASRRTFLKATGAAAGAAAVAGCTLPGGDGDGGGGGMQSRTYNKINSTITTFDPVAAGDTASGQVVQQVYDALMNYPNGEKEVVTSLAESYETNSDATQYTFTLKDAQYHPPGQVGEDGIDADIDRNVTASDFVYSFERLAASDNSVRKYFILESLGVEFEKADSEGGYSAGNYSPGTMNVNAVDESTLEINLREPFASSHQMLAYTSFSATPEGIVGDIEGYDGTLDYGTFAQEKPIGAGPFIFQFWNQENNAQANRYGDYHGEAAKVGAVHWAVIEDDDASFNYAMNGNADTFGVPTAKFDPNNVTINETDSKGRKVGEYGPLQNGETAQWLKVPEVSTFYFAFNTVDVPRPVRQAVAHATNQQALSTDVFKGRSPPAYHLTPPLIYPDGGNAYDDHVSSEYPYGPEASQTDQAKQVMEDAGYGPDNQFELQFTHYQSDAWSRLAQRLQQQLRTAHIQLNIEQSGFSSLLERGQNGQLEAYTLGWIADWPAPDNFLQLINPPSTITGQTGVLTYTNWGYDADGNRDDTQYSQQARDAWNTVSNNQQPTESAAEARAEAYIQMEEAMWNDAVLIPAFHGATERFAYDYMNVPKFGAMGPSRQMYNTFEKNESTGEPVAPGTPPNSSE